jgi:hypothetical protein
MNKRESEVKLNTRSPRERARWNPSSVNVKMPQVQRMVSSSADLEKRIADQMYINAINKKGENSKSHFLIDTLPNMKVTAIVITNVSEGVTGSKKIDKMSTQTTTASAFILGLISCKSIISTP